jgi:hypothetical protein
MPQRKKPANSRSQKRGTARPADDTRDANVDHAACTACYRTVPSGCRRIRPVCSRTTAQGREGRRRYTVLDVLGCRTGRRVAERRRDRLLRQRAEQIDERHAAFFRHRRYRRAVDPQMGVVARRIGERRVGREGVIHVMFAAAAGLPVCLARHRRPSPPAESPAASPSKCRNRRG